MEEKLRRVDSFPEPSAAPANTVVNSVNNDGSSTTSDGIDGYNCRKVNDGSDSGGGDEEEEDAWLEDDSFYVGDEEEGFCSSDSVVESDISETDSELSSEDDVDSLLADESVDEVVDESVCRDAAGGEEETESAHEAPRLSLRRRRSLPAMEEGADDQSDDDDIEGKVIEASSPTCCSHPLFGVGAIDMPELGAKNSGVVRKLEPALASQESAGQFDIVGDAIESFDTAEESLSPSVHASGKSSPGDIYTQLDKLEQSLDNELNDLWGAKNSAARKTSEESAGDLSIPLPLVLLGCQWANAEIERVRSHAQRQNRVIIDLLAKSHSLQLEEAQREKEAMKNEAERKHRDEIDLLTKSHSLQLDNLRAELQSSFSEEIHRIQAAAEEQQLAEIENVHRVLKESHAAEVEKVKSDMQGEQLDQLAASHKEEIARIRSEMESSASQALQARTKELFASHEQKMEEARKEKEAIEQQHLLQTENALKEKQVVEQQHLLEMEEARKEKEDEIDLLTQLLTQSHSLQLEEAQKEKEATEALLMEKEEQRVEAVNTKKDNEEWIHHLVSQLEHQRVEATNTNRANEDRIQLLQSKLDQVTLQRDILRAKDEASWGTRLAKFNANIHLGLPSLTNNCYQVDDDTTNSNLIVDFPAAAANADDGTGRHLIVDFPEGTQ